MEDRSAEDRALVDRALGGDEAAFERLVRAHQALVSAAVWRRGVARADLEDVVSEVFLKVYRNLHQYRPSHPFATWLYRLAGNHAIDHVRRRRREAARAEMPDDLTDPRPRAAESLETDERAALVRAGLESVSTRYRESMELVYFEGMKVDAVSKMLGVPTGTIKTRLMRGREQLRRALARTHPELFDRRDEEGDDAP